MTTSQLTDIEDQLESDYESASFEIEEGNKFPDLDEVARGKAIKLKDVAYGFIDLRGFTRWSEQKRDASVFKVLEPSLKALTRTIRLHNGSIEKPTGDGLMFVIGADESDSEVVAVSALQCAVDLIIVMDHVVNPFMKSKKHIGDYFQWGIGLEMGQALIAKVGIRNHYFLTSISKAANFASKLENLARQNQILVGENLYEETPDKVRSFLHYQGTLLDKAYYELKPETDSEGKPSIIKAMTANEIRRYGLEKWLLGGAVAVAALSGLSAMSQSKPHRWYGEEDEK